MTKAEQAYVAELELKWRGVADKNNAAPSGLSGEQIKDIQRAAVLIRENSYPQPDKPHSSWALADRIESIARSLLAPKAAEQAPVADAVLGEPAAWISVANQLPKAGKPVLAVFKNSLGNWRTTRAHYAPKLGLSANDWEDVDDCDEDADGNYFVPEGWYEDPVEIEVGAMIPASTPVTYWMPLPPNPDAAPAPQVSGAQVSDAEIVALLPGSYYMDPPDGGDVSLLEQLRRMAADAAAYRARQAVSLTDDARLKVIARAIAQEERACRAEDALIDLVNQIRKINPTDDHGHDLKMNMAYIKAVELLDAALQPHSEGSAR